MTLNLGLWRLITWTFVIADVDMPIIGGDLITYCHLLPDMHDEVLINGTTGLKSPGVSKKFNGFTISSTAPDPSNSDFSPKYCELLKKFQNTTLPQNLAHLPPVRSSNQHHIITQGPPISAHPRRLTEDKYKSAKVEFEQLVALVHLCIDGNFWNCNGYINFLSSWQINTNNSGRCDISYHLSLCFL